VRVGCELMVEVRGNKFMAFWCMGSMVDGGFDTFKLSVG